MPLVHLRVSTRILSDVRGLTSLLFFLYVTDKIISKKLSVSFLF